MDHERPCITPKACAIIARLAHASTAQAAFALLLMTFATSAHAASVCRCADVHEHLAFRTRRARCTRNNARSTWSRSR